MDRNSLWFVHENSIYNVNSHLKTVSLAQCKLDRIPQSLMRILFLEKLDLSKNNINSIYSNDLFDNTHIHEIDLANNPLKYISSGALLTVPNLKVLDLSNTKLNYVPKAILNLHSNLTVNLKHCLVECTCDLTWLRNMTADITIIGECDTISESIQNYWKFRVPKC